MPYLIEPSQFLSWRAVFSRGLNHARMMTLEARRD
jgi:hypothetical protein